MPNKIVRIGHHILSPNIIPLSKMVLGSELGIVQNMTQDFIVQRSEL